MVSFATLVVIVVGVVIGLLLGLTGGGGSIVTVPLLVYVVGLDAKVAIATSLLVVGLASLAAIVPHSRSGNVYWRTGIIFGLAGMVGAYTGGRIAQFVPDPMLLLFFAAVMIGSGSAMLRNRKPVDAARGAAPTEPQARALPRIVIDGLVVGIVTGLVGAGGGFLVVPALVLLGGLSMHAAIGTSLLVIAMKCFAGLAGYISHVPIDMHSAVLVSTLAIIGTIAGSTLSKRVPEQLLKRGFGVFVLIIAAILIVIEGSALLSDSFGLGRSPVAMTLAGAIVVVIAGVLMRARGRAMEPASPAQAVGSVKEK